jgi:glutamate N-acetyltransferase/amino-acid N-acetyltransferase
MAGVKAVNSAGGKAKKRAAARVNFASGGVSAPEGFRASGVHCGFRKNTQKKDLGIIVSDVPCNAAAVFTRNKVFGAPIIVGREHLRNGRIQAIICNSGIANTCAPGGIQAARETCAMLADCLGLKEKDILVSSTGVIGEKLPMDLFHKGIPRVVKKLSYDGSESMARAIMTTDKVRKEASVSFMLGGKRCRIGAVAKGSGMINPNMATMLSFITTDAAISAPMLRAALRHDVTLSFNQISVDGDTSTNDTVAILANGLAGNEEIRSKGDDFEVFLAALNKVTVSLCRMLARDGEGATKLIECRVKGAPSDKIARAVSLSVVQSDLVKTAVFGEDANWGRILCAIGYTDADFDCSDISVHVASGEGRVNVCRASVAAAFDEARASEILSADEIILEVNLHAGQGAASAWGCDLSYGYVRINGSYRT